MAIQRTYVSVGMVDGTEYESLPTTVADEMLYASTRRRHKWEPMQDDITTYKNFLGFAVLRRLGHYTGSFDDFGNDVAVVVLEEAEPVDPTNRAPSNA